MSETILRQCNLCEAGCGLRIELKEGEILSVEPDFDDPVSEGYVCPKGIAIADVHTDPDRLRRPLRRNDDGSFREISWDEAFDTVIANLRRIRDAHGPDAIALYFGNPMVHNFGGVLMLTPLVAALGTRNRMSAGSQDTSPRFAASHYLYGNTLVTPVPDLDHTDYFLCIGANPVVSNGSAMVVPNVKAHLRALRERGGKLVTVDPRRSETAKLASEHVFIRPGGDAAFLLAMVQALVESDRVDAAALARTATGWDEVAPRLAAFTPERVEAQTGIAAATTRRLAQEFADAPTSVAYTRVGTCNNRFGTLASWAGDLLNTVAGRLGETGGARFAEPALDSTRVADLAGMNGHGRWHSRVRGLPETGCDLPASILAEEIETPGEGQVRALLTIAGNPVLSTPNGRRLERAIESLDFRVAVDLYVNETTRHADVILPPCWALAEDHIEPLAPLFSLRNHVRWSPPVVTRGDDERADWQILLRLAEGMGGGPTGWRVLDGLAALAGRLGFPFHTDLALDLALRFGPHGDRFLPWKDGVNLARVKAAPRGLDLGPARTGVRHRISHRDGKVHLAAAAILASAHKLERELDAAQEPGRLVLIGRRSLRSNNSWMHNIPALVSGKPRCTLFVNPEDAARAGLEDGDEAWLESRVHRGRIPVQVSDEVMPGVVSLPHGWGHDRSAPWQAVAGAHAGVSVNDWTDDQEVEDVVGQSILNGVPVRLERASA